MTFIKYTMQTLLVYNEKLEICLNTGQIHLEITGTYLNIFFP